MQLEETIDVSLQAVKVVIVMVHMVWWVEFCWSWVGGRFAGKDYIGDLKIRANGCLRLNRLVFLQCFIHSLFRFSVLPSFQSFLHSYSSSSNDN